MASASTFPTGPLQAIMVGMYDLAFSLLMALNFTFAELTDRLFSYSVHTRITKMKDLAQTSITTRTLWLFDGSGPTSHENCIGIQNHWFLLIKKQVIRSFLLYPFIAVDGVPVYLFSGDSFKLSLLRLHISLAT